LYFCKEREERILKRILAYFFIIPIRCYQWCISPFLMPSCRHSPSCSTYSIIALKRFGIIKGSRLATNRIIRCRPGGTYGHDPVPKLLPKKLRLSYSVRKKAKKQSKRIASHW
jgi:putative membrane protein insertion efficiency factor